MAAADLRRVLAFYRFTPIADPAALRDELDAYGQALAIKGTILIADEGVNGTVVGGVAALESLAARLVERCGEIPFKWSDLNENNPGFHRYKVRVKSEIVSFGIDGLDVANTGAHVGVDRWHELLDDPDVVVIDTRNQYEVDIGSFPTARSPATDNFRQFPDWAESNLDPERDTKVAMFCTGGIRCEKASAYLLAQGFEEVYQLDGGILRYLEEVPADANRWRGECFVFDQRVSVTTELTEGVYEQCFACRHPLSAEELSSADFEQGVSCPYCVGDRDGDELAGLRERQQQVALAQARGDQHIGKPQNAREKSG